MNCKKCGISIPEAYDEDSCPNCALPKKDRIVSMRGDYVPPKIRAKPKPKKDPRKE